MSSRCRELDDAVCSLRARRVESRLRDTADEAIELCTYVGLDTPSEDLDNMYYELVESEFGYEAMEHDYDELLASSKSSKASSTDTSSDYDQFLGKSSKATSSSAKSSKATSSDYEPIYEAMEHDYDELLASSKSSKATSTDTSSDYDQFLGKSSKATSSSAKSSKATSSDYEPIYEVVE
jgi:hypothetical protein